MDKGGHAGAMFLFISKMIYSMTDSESSFLRESEMQLSATGRSGFIESYGAKILIETLHFSISS